MAFFNGYFDESGKFKDNAVISYCGFVADPFSWGDFQIEWEYLLRKHGMSDFHSKTAFRYSRPLSKRHPATGLKTRIEVINEFVRAAKKHAELGCADAVDVAGFFQLTHAQQQKLEDPHHVAFHASFQSIAEYVRAPDTVGIICDDEEKLAIACYRHFTELRKKHKQFKTRFVSIAFADDFYFPQLQAADLFAYITRLEARRRFLGEPHQFAEVVQEMNLSDPKCKIQRIEGRFWTKDSLASIMQGS